MKESLIFYACKVCGVMSMNNFRDTNCPACRVCMKVNEIEVCNIGGGGLEVWVNDAPHEDENE